MLTIVFDDHGRRWDARSHGLRITLGCPAPDFNFLDFVINNLGFVALSLLGNGALQIRLRPALVAPRSLAAALFTLADHKPERIVVTHPGDGCDDELFASVRKAVDRIGQLVSEKPGTTSQFMLESRNISDLTDQKDPLSALVSVWRDKTRIFDEADHADLLLDRLGGRFMTISRIVDRLTMEVVGPGFLSHDDKWRRNAIGRPVEDQPDYSYGLWARDLFKGVLDRGAPRLDDIDAIIRRPYFDDEVRVRYRCLILPYRHSSTANLRLLCASVVDEAVDLRGVANRFDAKKRKAGPRASKLL